MSEIPEYLVPCVRMSSAAWPLLSVGRVSTSMTSPELSKKIGCAVAVTPLSVTSVLMILYS